MIVSEQMNLLNIESCVNLTCISVVRFTVWMQCDVLFLSKACQTFAYIRLRYLKRTFRQNLVCQRPKSGEETHIVLCSRGK